MGESESKASIGPIWSDSIDISLGFKLFGTLHLWYHILQMVQLSWIIPA